MKFIRKLHLFLGCFFAPLLLFYTATGWYQTISVNRNKGLGEIGGWREKLTSVHVDQVYPTESAETYSPALFQGLVVILSIALIATTILGIYLAFKTSRKQWPIWVSLILGVIVPMILLYLGQSR
jgi:hypothetical protein